MSTFDPEHIPTIVLADDHPIVRYGMRVALESQRMAHVVAEASSPSELFMILAQVTCDIIVTDFSMPDDQGRDGLALIDRLMRTYPDRPLIVITALRNPALLNALLRQGVKGLVEKEGDVVEIGRTLQAVMKGREYISTGLKALLVAAGVNTSDRRGPPLTNAEIEILRLFAYDGMTSQEISKRINRSRKTISRHKRSALAKLGLRTDQDLIEYCRNNDLCGT